LRLAGDLQQYGYDPRRLCRDLLEHFRHLVAAKVSADPALLADLPDHEVSSVRQQANTCSLEDLQRFFTLLLRAEEEIGKTAYTQLVMEMTLVKLANQPPLMPIDEALARLDALQRQLLGNPLEPAASQSRLVRPSPPVPPAQPQSSPAAPPQEDSSLPPPSFVVREPEAKLRSIPAPATVAEPSGVWEGFLQAVQKEKISLFFPLKSGQMLELTQTALLIGVDKDPYFRELTRKENRLLLEDIAKRFFGRELAIEVTKGTVSRKTVVAQTAEVGQSQERSQEQQEGDDPLVQTVLDVLGGEVQGTRSYRS
jgi:DNA polymerase III gamma/tau subunit